MNPFILFIFLLISHPLYSQITIKKTNPINIQTQKAQSITIKNQKPHSLPISKQPITTLKNAPYKGKILNAKIRERIATLNGWVTPQTSDVWLETETTKLPLSPLPDGSFAQTVILHKGTNHIQLIGDGKKYDHYKIEADHLSTAPLRVTLTWQTKNNDIDLYLIQPNKKAIWFHNLHTTSANLDIDDTNGFGPENITLTKHLPGQYQIYVHYYDKKKTSNPVPFQVDVFIDEKLSNSYTGILHRASRLNSGPHNAGQSDSWIHVTNIHLN